MNSSELSYKDYTEYKVAQEIWTCVSPCLIFIGTIANILSIIVLVRKSMRTSTTMFYLTVLAFGDLFVLYTGLLRYWIIYTFDVDIRLLSNFGCKLHAFLVYFSLDFTSWILVAVTVDRCMSVFRPLTAKRICSLKKAKITVFIITVAMVTINVHLFGTVGVIHHLGELECQGMYDFMFSIWPWIDFCIVSIIPFSVMIVCNIIITRQIVLSGRRIKAHNTIKRVRTLSNRSEGGNAPDTESSQTSSCFRNRVPSVTVMLLTVNCVFLVLTLPIVVWLIGYPYWYVPEETTEHYRAELRLLWAIFNMMQYTNNAIHFFLYCLTGPRFRRELKAVFQKQNKIVTIDGAGSLTVEP